MKTIHRAQINMVIAEIRLRRRYRVATQAVKWVYWKTVYICQAGTEWVLDLNWPALTILIVTFVFWLTAVGFLRLWLVKELSQ